MPDLTLLQPFNLDTAGNFTFAGANVTGNLISGNANLGNAATANYFIGNGSQLTGIAGGSSTSISNGTSNVAVVSSGGNITIGVGGTGNVVVVATTGEFVTGVVSASGNITGNFFIGNGSQLTGIAGTYSNTNVANYLPTYTGNLVSLTGPVITTANVTGGNILTGGLVSATSTITSAANITGGNLLTAGLISATANVTGNYFIGNGSQLTGIAGTYSNTNVAAYLPTYTGNLVSLAGPVITTANITGGNILTGGQVSAAGNVTAGNVITGGGSGGNLTGANVISATTFSASGNVTGNYILGNGALLTGVITSVANINNGTSNVVVVSSGGNVSIGIGGTSNVAVFATTGEYVTGLISASGNVIANNGMFTTIVNVASHTGAVVSVSGNITGGNVITGSGSGGNLTGANVIFANTVSASANITSGNLLTAGLISATANVTGNYFIGNGSQLTGIDSSYGNANVVANLAALGSNPVSTTGNITGNYIIGNGSALISLTGANVTGTVANATYATSAGSADLAQYVTANAQANITSVGTLTALSVTGNVTGGNLIATTAVVTANIIGNSDVAITTTANANIYLQPNGTGNIVLANTYINSLAMPQQDYDAVTKLYVDNAITTGFTFHQAVNAATTTTLATATGGSITYAQPNGAANGIGAKLTTTGSFDLIDTANIQTVGTRVLVKNEANAVFNGVYVWANATNIVRSTDTDQYGSNSTEEIGLNDYFFVDGGNVNAGAGFIVNAPAGTITFGTSNITFAEFSRSQVYTANTQAGISLAGTVINAKVDNTTTAFDVGGNIIVKASANLTTPNIGAATGTSLSITANVTGGNLLTAGLISATANVTANNGMFTTIVNVASHTGSIVSVTGNVTANNGMFTNIVNVASHTGAIVSVTGNVTGNYFIGNGSALTGITASGGTSITNGTSNVVAAASGNVTVGVAGTPTVATFATTGLFITGLVSASGNITGGNLRTAGLISATGNVTGNYFIGNGSLLTGVSGGSGTSISNGTSNVSVVTANGNVSIGVGGTSNVAVFATTGEYVTGLLSVSGNIITAGLLSVAGNVNTSGNVNIGNADSVTWANATGIRAYTYYNNSAGSLDTVFL